jgi:hypothetical protein
MQATRAPTRSHRTSRVIAALPIIATTFFIHAMVWHYFRQLKMSRPDAYDTMAEERVVSRRRHSAQLRALVLEQCAPGFDTKCWNCVSAAAGFQRNQ